MSTRRRSTVHFTLVVRFTVHPESAVGGRRSGPFLRGLGIVPERVAVSTNHELRVVRIKQHFWVQTLSVGVGIRKISPPFAIVWGSTRYLGKFYPRDLPGLSPKEGTAYEGTLKCKVVSNFVNEVLFNKYTYTSYLYQKLNIDMYNLCALGRTVLRLSLQ